MFLGTGWMIAAMMAVIMIFRGGLMLSTISAGPTIGSALFFDRVHGGEDTQ